jgi:hypothetical protein
MKRGYKAGKIIMIAICVAGAIALFTFIVMSLWNAILPSVIHVGTITFWQALGILVLSKILFGGFHGKGGRWQEKRQHWKEKMQAKWQGMSPEEREKFKQSWKNRCGPWANRFNPEPTEDKQAGAE